MGNWTDSILDSKDPPLVHSVSYGWQGNLSQLHCTQAHIDDVDANLAKLAAKGISIIISSGDSGSGYSQQSKCQDPSMQTKDKGVDQGKLVQTLDTVQAICCIISQQAGGSNGSWTFMPDSPTCKEGCRGTCKAYSSVTSTKTQSGAISGGSAFSKPGEKVLL